MQSSLFLLHPDSSQTTKAHVLDLRILVDAVLGALPADAGLLDTTECALRAGHQTLVDAHHANLHLAGHTPALPDRKNMFCLLGTVFQCP